jgi:hypothetical protein
MAKYKRVVPVKIERYSYPSRYGSHSSMIDEEKTEELNSEDEVVLKDEFGFYTTQRKMVDNGLADPKRYQTDRVTLRR